MAADAMPEGTVTRPEIDPVAAAARAVGGAGLSVGGVEGVGVAVGVGVAEGVGVGVAEGDGVGEGVPVAVGEGLAVGVAVTAGVGLGVEAADAGLATTEPARTIPAMAVAANQERTRVRG
ncbi:hypothetical protein CSIV_08100 [Microbacterium sp. CSI-V]|uniref:hypothetical protein n=1 Tax=unclassified Microbacterium TaxID=2609290 RepID=UPI00097CA6D2|nr:MULTISPECIES: hypothetical protein [unclassified Microbacterium]ONI64689.1 hypothetical protein CSIV_08100 [Microbacterium sp. CSI-V]